MSYFSTADDLSKELVASFELFLATDEGRRAAELADSGFDLGDGLPEEPTVVVVTSRPTTTTTLVLGKEARVEAGGSRTGLRFVWTRMRTRCTTC
ncbi:hypothetical protein ACR6C2_04915 [Streptomyces sp. INA 01156]